MIATKRFAANLVGFTCAVLSWLAGIFYPIMQGENIFTHGLLRVNIIWDVIYGIGFMLYVEFFHKLVLNAGAGLVGSLIWPTLIFALVWFVAFKVTRHRGPLWGKIIIFAFFLATLAWTMPLSKALKLSLPLYTTYSFVNF